MTQFRNAYVTLVMGGDFYVPGVLALGQSLRLQQSQYPLVCMVTSEVSKQCRTWLETVCTVVAIDKLEMRTKPFRSAAQQHAYGSWIGNACTKWQCLSLTQFDKVFFLDADTLVVQPLDHIFDIIAPAGCFGSNLHVLTVSVDLFKEIPHGSTLTYQQVLRGLNECRAPAGSGLLLSPSQESYNMLLRIVDLFSPNVVNTATTETREYGFPITSESGHDEQLIAHVMCQLKHNWTALSQRYNLSSWTKPNRMPKDGNALVLHFMGGSQLRKPWQSHAEQHPSLQLWWQTIHSLLETASIPEDLKHHFQQRIHCIQQSQEESKKKLTIGILMKKPYTPTTHLHHAALQLADEFQKRGWNIWWIRHNIYSIEDQARLPDKINSCQVVAGFGDIDETVIKHLTFSSTNNKNNKCRWWFTDNDRKLERLSHCIDFVTFVTTKGWLDLVKVRIPLSATTTVTTATQV